MAAAVVQIGTAKDVEAMGTQADAVRWMREAEIGESSTSPNPPMAS